MKKIITISREFGAGGGELGRIVAKRLGYHYYDKELIMRAAEQSNVNVESVRRWDEKVPMNFGFAQSLFDFYNKPLDEKLFEVQQKVIREIGEKGNCVIVGRNANTILKEFDHVLHVFVHATPNWRLTRMKEKMPNTTEEKLEEELREIDQTRRKYCSYHTGTEFGEAKYYDICLCTSSLGIEKCADIVYELAKQ